MTVWSSLSGSPHLGQNFAMGWMLSSQYGHFIRSRPLSAHPPGTLPAPGSCACSALLSPAVTPASGGLADLKTLDGAPAFPQSIPTGTQTRTGIPQMIGSAAIRRELVP